MNLKQVAVETLQIIQDGGYTTPTGTRVSVASEQKCAEAGTRLYMPGQLEMLLGRATPIRASEPPTLAEVTDETTQVAAHRLAQAGHDVVLLNFASARSHGGGFLGGARAQEEDLCRCSGLYPTLLVPSVQTYYEVNREQRSLLYTDHMIYSPKVPWFRVQGRGQVLDRPFFASVITAPAPNAGPLLRRDPGAAGTIAPCFTRRWGSVLAIAQEQGHRVVVLGAWGCGAFRNDPEVAARTVLRWLTSTRFVGAFSQVVFAIPSSRLGQQSARNHDVFRKVLLGG